MHISCSDNSFAVLRKLRIGRFWADNGDRCPAGGDFTRSVGAASGADIIAMHGAAPRRWSWRIVEVDPLLQHHAIDSPWEADDVCASPLSANFGVDWLQVLINHSPLASLHFQLKLGQQPRKKYRGSHQKEPHAKMPIHWKIKKIKWTSRAVLGEWWWQRWGSSAWTCLRQNSFTIVSYQERKDGSVLHSGFGSGGTISWKLCYKRALKRQRIRENNGGGNHFKTKIAGGETLERPPLATSQGPSTIDDRGLSSSTTWWSEIGWNFAFESPELQMYRTDDPRFELRPN
jgi:hypothetical protein